MNYKTTISLGKIAYSSTRKVNEAEIEISIEQKTRDSKRDINLKPVSDYVTVSFMGGIWNAGHTDYDTRGQCVDKIRKAFRGNAKVKRLCNLWERWHLNDMKCGTAKQNAAIEAWEAKGNRYDYTLAYGHLESLGLLTDDGYTYGHAWLVEIVPNEVLEEIKSLAESFNKQTVNA